MPMPYQFIMLYPEVLFWMGGQQYVKLDPPDPAHAPRCSMCRGYVDNAAPMDNLRVRRHVCVDEVVQTDWQMISPELLTK